MVDYMSVVTVVAPIVAAIVGFFGKRALELRPRIVSFMASANSVTVGKGGQNPVQINSHVLVIRNDGRLVAKNVRVIHDFLPQDFSIYPGLEYEIFTNPEDRKEIQFASIVPGQQVTISYIYYPPATWHNVNGQVVSEQGISDTFWALPKPNPPWWQNWIRYTLMFYGGWAVVYWLAKTAFALVTKTPLFVGW